MTHRRFLQLAILVAVSMNGVSMNVGDRFSQSESLSIAVRDVESRGKLSLDIRNNTSKSLRIWKDSNIWGAARWRVLIVRGRSIQTFFQNPEEIFTRNIPTFDEIAPHASVQRVLDLNDGGWIGEKGSPPALRKGDVLIVIYDVPRVYGWPAAPITIEARDLNVWYGVAVSMKTVE